MPAVIEAAHVTQITVAAISAAGVIGAAWFAYRAKVAEKNALDREQSARRELTVQAAGLDFAAFVSDWEGCERELSSLMDETEVDRFVMLRSYNGADVARWVSSIWQLRRYTDELGRPEKPVSYTHIELDTDYQMRLRSVVASGSTVIGDVASLPDCLIRRIYAKEKVTASAWFLLEAITAEDGSKKLTLCSFATRREGGFSEGTLSECFRVACRFRGAAAAYRLNGARRLTSGDTPSNG